MSDLLWWLRFAGCCLTCGLVVGVGVAQSFAVDQTRRFVYPLHNGWWVLDERSGRFFAGPFPDRQTALYEAAGR